MTPAEFIRFIAIRLASRARMLTAFLPNEAPALVPAVFGLALVLLGLYIYVAFTI